jgi:hypothetical protein
MQEEDATPLTGSAKDDADEQSRRDADAFDEKLKVFHNLRILVVSHTGRPGIYILDVEAF